MRRVGRGARALTGALLVAGFLVTAGCTETGDEPRVASAGGNPSGTATGADAVTAYVESARAYVACLREQGIEVSDPDSRGQFEFAIDGDVLRQNPVLLTEFREKQMACGGILLPLPAELYTLPPMTPEEIEQRQRWAECMQTNGAPDFPDPGPDGYYARERQPPTPGDGTPLAWDPTTEEARRAERICNELIFGQVPGEPQG